MSRIQDPEHFLTDRFNENNFFFDEIVQILRSYGEYVRSETIDYLAGRSMGQNIHIDKLYDEETKKELEI